MKILITVYDLEPHADTLWRRPVTVPQLAEALAVPYRTAHRWVTDGLIPARRFGKTWQVPRVVIVLMQEKCELT